MAVMRVGDWSGQKESEMDQNIVDVVRSKYGSVAKSGLSSQNVGVRAVAEAFGYSPEQLASIPAEANMGLSCGNPTAFAGLRPGEVVVDLGCGGGLDVFLAAAKVGPTGKAIGIDMTPEMIERARKNAARGTDGEPIANVEFHLATIDKLPLADASVDCVISNCVINLVPDKLAVFREIARVLKPGGRLAVSDIVLKKPLPPELAHDLAAYVGCLAGAIGIEDYRSGLHEAGFGEMEIVDTGADLNAYSKVESQSGCSCCGPALPLVDVATAGCCSPAPAAEDTAFHTRMNDLCARYDFNEYAASVKIFAVKR
jgi:arsenite methyltransferase